MTMTMAGQTLPSPQRWQEARYSKATKYRGMDGTVTMDTRAGATPGYVDVIIEWADVLPAERTAIEAAWKSLLETGSVAFVDMLGNNYTATYMPDAKPLSITAYTGMRADDPVFQTLYQITASLRLE